MKLWDSWHTVPLYSASMAAAERFLVENMVVQQPCGSLRASAVLVPALLRSVLHVGKAAAVSIEVPVALSYCAAQHRPLGRTSPLLLRPYPWLCSCALVARLQNW